MRKLLLALALLWPTGAWAQCTGVFPANTLCGNLSGAPAPPAAFSSGGTVAGPGSSTSGHFVTFANSVGSLISDVATITTSQAVTLSGFVTIVSQFSVTASAAFTGVTNFTSQFQVNQNRIQFPVGPDTVGGLGTSQFWTSPNSFSTLFASQFFTNGVSLTTPLSVSNGGTGTNALSAHAVILGNGTNPVSGTVLGTKGQCLVSNGSTVDPSYISGCAVLLNTLTTATSVANLQDTTSITSAFNDYDVTIEACLPATGANTLLLQNFINGGLATSNYVSMSQGVTAAPAFNAATSTASVILNAGLAQDAVTYGWSGVLHLSAPNTNGQRRWTGVGGLFQSSGPNESPITVSGRLNVNAVVSGFSVQFGIGNIASCTIKVYGRL